MRCAMSCCNPDEGIQFVLLERRIHKARTQKVCANCQSNIPSGEFYRVEIAIVDGEFVSRKTHNRDCENDEWYIDYEAEAQEEVDA